MIQFLTALGLGTAGLEIVAGTTTVIVTAEAAAIATPILGLAWVASKVLKK